ncbi:MAG TPA: hypothetical protein VG498_24485, partial [Terriglobales bacterium]|nr:hypothetical protein [Terriglobales bacterium]
LTRHAMLLLVAGICLGMLGCTPKIPNKVTQDEYQLYREWLKHHFASKAPEQLFLDDQTFVFDPMERRGCGDVIHRDDQVPWSLMRALHALRNADYELDVSPSTMQIPWPYQVLNPRRLPNVDRGLHIIGFSRVAFSRDGSQGLFAFSDACAMRECGGGGAVLANKLGNSWEFSQLKSCSWMY